jgi:hypothetical protein
VARVLAIRDGGDTGGPIHLPGIEASTDSAQSVAPEEQPPPVQAGISTSQVRIRVDFALAK